MTQGVDQSGLKGVRFSSRHVLLAALVLVGLGLGWLFGPRLAALVTPVENQLPADLNAVDVGFAQSMMLHHAAAIQMAMAVKAADDPHLRGIAQNIVLNQTRESGVLEGWLTAWKQPVMAIGPQMAWVEQARDVQHVDDQLYASQCKDSGGKMAGMPSAQDIEALAALTGVAQQRRFYELMIAHHSAAIPMGWFAYRNGQSSLVRAMARSMIRDQAFEIAWMQTRLQALGAP